MSDTTLVTEASTPTDAPPAEGTMATQVAAETTATQQPSTETAEAATEADATKTEAKAEVKAPEKYEFKAPEGVSLNESVIGEFEGVARELNLPQEAAQKLIDRIAPKLAQSTTDQQVANLKKAGETWMTEVSKAPDIGGEHLTETKASVAKAMQSFATPELRALLDQTRLGNHPEVVRLLAKVGKAISEDTKPATGRATAPEKTATSAFYPTMTQGA